LVMEEGIISEEGSHSQLMKQPGKYAEMFSLQKQRYEEKEEQPA